VTELLDDLLDRHELAQMLRCSTRTVDRMMGAPDGLPFIKLRGKVLYRASSVREWLAARERQSAPRRQGRAA
jgi:hypothetical protein